MDSLKKAPHSNYFPGKEYFEPFMQKFTGVDLISGHVYRIIKDFKDYDGTLHPIGEVWQFLEKNFLPYEDGLSLFVERDGKKISFRLQWREESQASIIDNFSDFAQEI